MYGRINSMQAREKGSHLGVMVDKVLALSTFLHPFIYPTNVYGLPAVFELLCHVPRLLYRHGSYTEELAFQRQKCKLNHCNPKCQVM